MTKSVFLSAGGDPFIASLVLKLWKERWYDEVDTMWICYNNHASVPYEVSGEFLQRASQDPKVRIIYSPRGLGNGVPITLMTKCSTDDLVMLLEDDGFIFEPGHVSRCFQQIESDLTDALGSPRGSCGVEVTEAAAKKYNIDLSAYGDSGVNFWPNTFFCKRADLLKTDMDFGSHTWKPGEYSRELDHTFKEINHGDTFAWACVQLRAMGLRFQNIPQFHADPYEIESKQKGEMNWWKGQRPYWWHAGSLSAGWNGYLSDRTPDVSNDSAMREMETRCAFWFLATEQVEGFDSFKVLYKDGIKNLIQRAGLDTDRIMAKHDLYKLLMRL